MPLTPILGHCEELQLTELAVEGHQFRVRFIGKLACNSLRLGQVMVIKLLAQRQGERCGLGLFVIQRSLE